MPYNLDKKYNGLQYQVHPLVFRLLVHCQMYLQDFVVALLVMFYK